MADAKQIVKRLFEEPWKGNLDVIDEHIAPSYIGHDPSEPEGINGPGGFRDFIQKYLSAFPDGQMTVDDQILEGEKIATRWTGRGTHKGEIAGIAPTGKQITVTGLTISHLEGDMVVEDWTTWDTLGMLIQMGVVPAPAQV
jgi:predicted ester cyclase